MNIGVPKETKNHEYRVGLTPASAASLIQNGHCIYIETLAGSGLDIEDEQYIKVGATILSSAIKVYEVAQLIIKVKEPSLDEAKLLKPRHILFTYLHLAANIALTKALLKSKATCIAYETITADDGSLPLLAPMSEIAGRLSIQAGTTALTKNAGGRGLLLGGATGIPPANVVIMGGGVVGINAAQMAVGLGGNVMLFDNNLTVIKKINQQFSGRVKALFAEPSLVAEYVTQADLLIGAVLVAGATAPKVITRKLVSSMKKGSVIVDVAIDQGGCIETSKATTHQQPTYIYKNVIHYCVSNMPGAVPYTATLALNNSTLPFIMAIANKGIYPALLANKHLKNGVNTFDGKLTNKDVATSITHEYCMLNEQLMK